MDTQDTFTNMMRLITDPALMSTLRDTLEHDFPKGTKINSDVTIKVLEKLEYPLSSLFKELQKPVQELQKPAYEPIIDHKLTDSYIPVSDDPIVDTISTVESSSKPPSETFIQASSSVSEEVMMSLTDECQICFDRSIDNTKLLSCGHQVLCGICIAKVKSCPMCRADAKIIRVYRPTST